MSQVMVIWVKRLYCITACRRFLACEWVILGADSRKMKINRSNNIWFRLRLELLPQNRIQRDHFYHFYTIFGTITGQYYAFFNKKYTFSPWKLRFLNRKTHFTIRKVWIFRLKCTFLWLKCFFKSKMHIFALKMHFSMIKMLF